MKKKTLIILAIVIIVIIALIGTVISQYNGLAQSRESITSAESAIQTQLQRRADLIPNLVSTVKTYMEHETEVITAVTEARAKMTGSTTTEQMLEADQQLSSALSRLLVVVENYPELKSNENFIQLQDELAGTENRITAARQDYNSKVEKYNKTLISFPGNIFAGMFGFQKAEYFEATPQAQQTPDVSDLFDR